METKFAEIVFADNGREVKRVSVLPLDKPPPVIRRHGVLFAQIRSEIVSGSDQETHWRYIYRRAR